MGLDGLLEEAGYTVEQGEAERHSRYRFRVLDSGEELAGGTHFTGSGNILPWIELHLEEEVEPEVQGYRDLFDALSRVLEPGSHLMVHYLGTRTSEALTADVPPPATPLGFLMWDAGFRWFNFRGSILSVMSQ